MSLLSSIITLILAFSVSWFLMRPFWRQAESEECQAVRAENLDHLDLEARQSRILGAYEELEADKLAGKVTDEEYLNVKRELAEEVVRATSAASKLSESSE